MFYVTTTAKRKGAKRHIVTREETFEQAKRLFDMLNNKRYIYEIVNAKWETIESKGEA